MILREVRQKEAEENLESCGGGLETNLNSSALRRENYLLNFLSLFLWEVGNKCGEWGSHSP